MAAGNTYTPIATYTTGSGETSYTFTSVPTTYTDLILISNFAFTANNLDFRIQVGNGSIDTGTNYSFTFLNGTGSAASSTRSSSTTYIAGYQPIGGGTGKQISISHFNNYSNTTTYKTVLLRNNDPALELNTGVGLWRNTSAINYIKVAPTGTFATGSIFTLYGILAA
jgi:hypothetical protein